MKYTRANIPVNHVNSVDLQKTVSGTFSDNRVSTSVQLKQQQLMQNAGIVQRAEKWWPTNAEHTTVTGGVSATQPEGSFVKREKAGASDELFSTQDDAWTKAKGVSLANRPHNTDLFSGTSEKMATEDGNRTYLSKEDSKKDVSIVVTHTTDPQSNVVTEGGDKLKVTHTHSAFAKHKAVKDAIKDGVVPAYSNSPEAKVHYLSLTQQT